MSSLSTLQLSNTVANDKVQQVWASEVAILCWATQDFVARDDHNIFWAFDAQALSQGLCKPGEPKRCAASVGCTTMMHRWPVAAEPLLLRSPVFLPKKRVRELGAFARSSVSSDIPFHGQAFPSCHLSCFHSLLPKQNRGLGNWGPCRFFGPF